MATTFAGHGTLTASTVATVTLTRDFQRVEVLNVTGSAAIYFTVDGSNPTVAGDDTYVVPAVTGASFSAPANASGSTTVVKLISSGTPGYAVTGLE